MVSRKEEIGPGHVTRTAATCKCCPFAGVFTAANAAAATTTVAATQQGTHPVGGGTTPGFQPTMRLNAQQATEVIGNAPRLICTAGPVLGQEFPVGQGVYIGRDGTRSQIVVSDPQVSGQHCGLA